LELAFELIRLVTEVLAREADTINDMGRRGATLIIGEASLETGSGSGSLLHGGDGRKVTVNG
jgi:hypothetical protein